MGRNLSIVPYGVNMDKEKITMTREIGINISAILPMVLQPFTVIRKSKNSMGRRIKKVGELIKKKEAANVSKTKSN